MQWLNKAMLKLLIENILVREDKIMVEWKKIVLADVLVEKGYIRGPFGSALKRGEMKESGIPVYEQQHAIYDSRYFRYFVDEQKFNEMKRYQVHKDDLIISCSGTVGKVSIIREKDPKGIISQALLLLRVNKNKILPLYLKYYLLSREGYNAIISRSSGSVQVNLAKRSVIEQIPLMLPNLETQKRIVEVLNSIDEKIELNNRINNNLEQQATALYKDWFFDFSPFSSDRNLPDGWCLGTVGDVIQLHDSKRVPLSRAERDKMIKVYPYYGATSLMDYVDNYLFDGIYLLLGEDGTVVDSLGFPILQYVYGQFWVNNHAHIITGKEGFSVEELYLLFSLTNIKSIVTGAVQQKVSQQNLKKVPAIIPSKEALDAFDEIIQPIFAQIRNLRDENENLSQLRDTLLPKLMSGEFDVSDINL